MSVSTADVAPLGSKRGDGHAELRFRRIATFAVGVSITAYLVADLATIRAQAGQFSAAWSVPAIAGQAIAGIAFLALPWFVGERALRAAAMAFAGFGTLVLALAIPAASDPPVTGGVPWPLLVKTNYAMAAMLGLPTVAAWCAIGVMALIAIVVDGSLSAQADPLVVTENLVSSLSVTVLLAFVLQLLLRAGRQLDLAEADAVRAVRRDAADAAAASERLRIELLTHDAVLSTLRAASLGLDSATMSPQMLAQAALDRLARPDEGAVVVDGEELGSRLRSLATHIAPDARVTVAIGVDTGLPADAATALLEAGGEALRNSVAYAGTTAVRRIELRVDASHATIVLSDDGVGFIPSRVPRHRLGISRSILERVQAVPGGAASIVSRPGAGTTVTLEWRR